MLEKGRSELFPIEPVMSSPMMVRAQRYDIVSDIRAVLRQWHDMVCFQVDDPTRHCETWLSAMLAPTTGSG